MPHELDSLMPPLKQAPVLGEQTIQIEATDDQGGAIPPTDCSVPAGDGECAVGRGTDDPNRRGADSLAVDPNLAH